MKLARDTGLLSWRYTLQYRRNPVLAVRRVVDAAALPGALRAAGQGPAGDRRSGRARPVSPGILALLAFGSGISMGFGTIFELQAGSSSAFAWTPTSRLALLLGPLVSGVAWMFLFDAVLVVVGAAFGFHVHIGGLLVLAVLLALFHVVDGVLLVADGAFDEEISGFAAVVNGLNLPVLLLAGVLLPVGIGPAWMKVLAHFNPLYYLVAAARSLGVGTFLRRARRGRRSPCSSRLTALTLAWATAL